MLGIKTLCIATFDIMTLSIKANRLTHFYINVVLSVIIVNVGYPDTQHSDIHHNDIPQNAWVPSY
jgi:hypothetical protein